MSVKDIASNLRTALLSAIAVAANGVVNGNSVDGADYELGLMFVFDTSDYTDGDHAVSLEESDDDAAWTAVPAEKLIGTPPVISAASVEGDALPKLGVFSNKRYVRPVITSTGVTTGADIRVLDVQKAEHMPV